MKKLIALALVATLIFAFSTSVYALSDTVSVNFRSYVNTSSSYRPSSETAKLYFFLDLLIFFKNPYPAEIVVVRIAAKITIP